MTTKQHFLGPRHLFVAYARMRATRSGFPEVRDYWQKRYRILSQLFGVDFETGVLEWVAEYYARAANYNPLGVFFIGPRDAYVVDSYRMVRGRLRRSSAELRKAYLAMAMEIMRNEYPGLEMRRVDVRRLRQFGLPAKPPDPNEACLRALESDDCPNDSPVIDDVTPEMLDRAKEQEEKHERFERRKAIAAGTVRERALAHGLGTEETIDGVLYNMSTADFLDLSADFPMLSRVHFRPPPTGGG